MWFRRLGRSRRSPAPSPVVRRTVSRAGRPLFESLEKKEMLSADAPRVLDITADNRGLVSILVDADLNAATVDQSSVRFFEAGDDGLLGTPDDQVVNDVDVTYSFGDRTITADARLTAGTMYGVILDGSIIRGANGCFLDGEFNGLGTASGDGAEGGDTLFYARQTGMTVARVFTNLGNVDLELFPGDTPITVENFLRYANEGLYDRTFFHRSVEGFVVQGGGFEADVPFLPIPTFDPILNEPGISNTRGTVAMAKLGGDPNSATSQWFFNLGDNSENLDNQNGGFTVFGRVLDDESLAVVDAIAALERFNASQTNGAFSEVPVLDLPLIEEGSGLLMERDIVRVDRVSQLLTVSAEPFGQLDTDEVRTISDDASAARITVFSLSGASLGDVESLVRVRFGAGDAIRDISIRGQAPGPIGIQITGATSVGSITERTSGSSLSFIVSSAPIQQIALRNTITGAQLNGVLLADSVLLPEDIDGDNAFDDATAIFIESGNTRQVRLDGGVSGDILIPGGLQDLRVQGLASRVDVRTGANDLGEDTDLRFETARDVVVISGAPIGRAMADEWRPFNTQNALLEAPSITSLRVRGDFGADLRTTGAGVEESLGSVRIDGDVFRSSWDIQGDAGTIRFRESATWDFVASGDIRSFRMEDSRNSTISVNGDVRSFRSGPIDGALIDLNGALSFKVSGGDVSGSTIALGVGNTPGGRSVNLTGGLIDSSLTSDANLNRFRVKGELNGAEVTLQDTGELRFGVVTDTEMLLRTAPQLRVTSWDGGSFQASEVRAIRSVGNGRAGDAGDFNAELVVSNAPIVRIAGGVEEGDFRLGDNIDFRVGGDLIASEIRFFQLQFFATNAARGVAIEGSMMASAIYANSNVDSIRTDAMIDSSIYIGNTGDLEGFPSGNVINDARINEIIIRGSDQHTYAFDNSFIAGGRIDYVRLMEPRFVGSQAFGVAGDVITRVDVISPTLTRAFNAPDEGVIVSDDLQLRPGFQAPA